MGSLVFGGGQVLMPMMYEQLSVRPEVLKTKDKNLDAIQIDEDDMYTGMGIVRAMPGPVFSIASFTGGMALKDMGTRNADSGLPNRHGCNFSSQRFIGLVLFSDLEQPKKICGCLSFPGGDQCGGSGDHDRFHLLHYEGYFFLGRKTHQQPDQCAW